jgi:hypothetical protein
MNRLLAAIMLAGLSSCSALDQPAPERLLLRGNVDMAMVDKARAAASAGTRHFIIDSRGGYLIPAMALGAVIHRSRASVTARGECLSACVLVLMSAADRRVAPGTAVAFHDSADPAVSRVAAEYLSLQGVPSRLIADYVGTVNVRPLSALALTSMGVKHDATP